MKRSFLIRVQGLLTIGALSGAALAQPACDETGTVESELRIGQFGSSGFTGLLDPGDIFGNSVAHLGDRDTDADDFFIYLDLFSQGCG